MNHFNTAVEGCKRRQQSKPRISYEPGCHFIECEHADCRCIMNDGDGGPVSDFIQRWNARHGRAGR
jgi:hypothetical protein